MIPGFAQLFCGKMNITNVIPKLQSIINPYERRLDIKLQHERINQSEAISVRNNLENHEETQRRCMWIGLIKTGLKN